MAAFAPVGVANRHAREIRVDRVVHVFLLDPEEFELVLIDGDTKPFAGRVEAVVHVDDKGDALENFLESRRRRPSRFRIRPIDLGEKRRKHRRSRRNFDNLQRRVFRHVEAAKLFANFEFGGPTPEKEKMGEEAWEKCMEERMMEEDAWY
jgi:hypothetical protein